MEFNNKLVNVSINRAEENIYLIFNELNDFSINLSNSSVEDIKELFDILFDVIVEQKELITLNLADDKNDLFNEVAVDIIDQLNSEIKQAESDLLKIIELNSN